MNKVDMCLIISNIYIAGMFIDQKKQVALSVFALSWFILWIVWGLK